MVFTDSTRGENLKEPHTENSSLEANRADDTNVSRDKVSQELCSVPYKSDCFELWDECDTLTGWDEVLQACTTKDLNKYLFSVIYLRQYDTMLQMMMLQTQDCSL